MTMSSETNLERTSRSPVNLTIRPAVGVNPNPEDGLWIGAPHVVLDRVQGASQEALWWQDSY